MSTRYSADAYQESATPRACAAYNESSKQRGPDRDTGEDYERK